MVLVVVVVEVDCGEGLVDSSGSVGNCGWVVGYDSVDFD
jgi:hypothetical protein